MAFSTKCNTVPTISLPMILSWKLIEAEIAEIAEEQIYTLFERHSLSLSCPPCIANTQDVLSTNSVKQRHWLFVNMQYHEFFSIASRFLCLNDTFHLELRQWGLMDYQGYPALWTGQYCLIKPPADGFVNWYEVKTDRSAKNITH